MHLGAEPSRIELYRCTPRRGGANPRIEEISKHLFITIIFYCIPEGITAVII